MDAAANNSPHLENNKDPIQKTALNMESNKQSQAITFSKMKVTNQYFVYLQTKNLKPVYSQISRATGLYCSMTFILIVRF